MITTEKKDGPQIKKKTTMKGKKTKEPIEIYEDGFILFTKKNAARRIPPIQQQLSNNSKQQDLQVMKMTMIMNMKMVMKMKIIMKMEIILKMKRKKHQNNKNKQDQD
jgi:type IV secretory pathway VirB9-like protein